MNLFLGQLDPGIYRVANLVQESLSGIRRLDVADSSFLEKARTGGRKAVLGDTVGSEMGSKPSIGPGEVGGGATAVVLVPGKGGELSAQYSTQGGGSLFVDKFDELVAFSLGIRLEVAIVDQPGADFRV